MDRKIKLWMFFGAVMLLLLVPERAKAGTQITGGRDRSSAVTVQLEQE